MTARRGLGRGLGSLIPAAPTPTEEQAAGSAIQAPPRQPLEEAAAVARELAAQSNASNGAGAGTASADSPDPDSAAYFTTLGVHQIEPNPRQPRTAFDEDSLAELAGSVALVGLLQPVVVRPAGAGRFELVMGERRWRAAQLAGLQEVPAIVRHTRDGDLLRDALLENIHRAQLNPLEEAAAYQQLLEDFGVTQEELAGRLGRSRPHISNTIRLLRLTPAVQRRVAAGVLSAGHARALVSVDDPHEQERLASQVVAEGLSVRAVEELVALLPVGSAVPRQRSRAAQQAPELMDIGARLSERFDTRCKVELGRRRGKITIEFATLDDLRRIVRELEP